VGHTEARRHFYRDILGLHVVGKSENYGPEQERLTNVFGARLCITTLRAAAGPAIEFLEYLTPRHGRPIAVDEPANDLGRWQTTLVTRRVSDVAQRVRTALLPWVSPGVITLLDRQLGLQQGLLVRHPDGHVLQLVAP
jgi:catechol 2,3-dioxygenase-like lactoylglutathione lyase family enzyme